MKKYLGSDWLRTVQFQGNTVPEKVTIICIELPFSGTLLPFSCILLIGNSTCPSESCYYILIVFEKLTRVCFFQIELETMLLHAQITW